MRAGANDKVSELLVSGSYGEDRKMSVKRYGEQESHFRPGKPEDERDGASESRPDD